MKYKFKVGDTPTVRQDLSETTRPCGLRVQPGMLRLRGKKVTITNAWNAAMGHGARYAIKECDWTFCDDCFDDVPSTIIITTDGRTTTARLKDGKQTVREAKAVCNSSDTFSFNVGASLALSRLLYGTDYNPNEVKLTTTEDKPPEKHTYKVGDLVEFISVPGGSDVRAGHIGQIVSLEDMVEYYQVKDLNTSKTWYSYGSNFKPYAPAVREVKRPAKVGEWVKVVSSDVSTLPVGYITECVGRWEHGAHLRNNRGNPSGMYDSRYVVLENYVPEKQEEPKPDSPISISIPDSDKPLFIKFNGVRYEPAKE